MEPKGILFLTRREDIQITRRGDPLGFASIADDYAEMLAPGITNRHLDARWITLLCWSLKQVSTNFQNATPEEWYDHLRGLELHWIIQSLKIDSNDGWRQLPGRRSVKTYLGKNQKTSLRDVMGPDQWKRYRHVGPYAAYRRLLQACNFLEEDGRSLTSAGESLSNLVTLDTNPSTNISPGDSQDGWIRYWQRRFPVVEEITWLPLPIGNLKLTITESKLISPPLFEADDSAKRRKQVAEALKKTENTIHYKMCEELQEQLQSISNWNADEKNRLGYFFSFAKLSDTAVTALREAYKTTVKGPRTISDAINEENLKVALEELQEASKEWNTLSNSGTPYPELDEFSIAISSAEPLDKILHKLLLWHLAKGGGAKWFSISGEQIDRPIRHASPPFGYYRFRLNALARLAVGCGVISKLPPAFSDELDESDVDPADDQEINNEME